MRNRARLAAAAIVASVAASAAAGAIGHVPPAPETGRFDLRQGPPEPRKFYREWTTAELWPSVSDLGVGHDWAAGRELFRKAGCGICHAFGSESEGTGLAPDLTGVASTFGREFILQSIVEPSATINGRFFQTKLTLKNGTVVTGSVIEVADKKILIAPVMMNPQATVEIAEADVKSEEPSPVSPMPSGLLNEFAKEQVVELMAYLEAGGDRNAAVYKKK